MERKPVLCPCCGSRLIDESVTTECNTYEIERNKQKLADFYVKCWKCKKDIAIVMTSKN
ncbi:hypothetical protein ACRQU7_07735 [Caproiciproducens sp. R1]|uniref:hypothetical protein n=1 Tax=Caproiciproducens sp. R1 TaxID=3435000 RepID=UPI00403475A5